MQAPQVTRGPAEDMRLLTPPAQEGIGIGNRPLPPIGGDVVGAASPERVEGAGIGAIGRGDGFRSRRWLPAFGLYPSDYVEVLPTSFPF